MSKINGRGWIKTEKVGWAKVWNILKVLEDPDHPCVGPNLRLLRLMGQWHPNQKSVTARIKLIIFYVIILIFSSQYAKCLINTSIRSILLIIQYTPFHMGVLKMCLFQKDYKAWEELIGYVSSTERRQLAEGDGEVRRAMDTYIRRSRHITYFFWTMAVFSNINIYSEPYHKNEIVENGTNVYFKIFDFATPFDQEVPPGYYVSMVIQTVLGNLMTVHVGAWDTLVMSMMIFFAGQLQISRIYCTKVISSRSVEQSHSNIVLCHNFHISLIKHQKSLNTLISPVMGVYLGLVSINLGILIIQITSQQDDIAAVMSSVTYVAACLVQLLFFYWFGSQVTEESALLNYGIFESHFVEMNAKILKEVNLLQLATSKHFVFSAGPFNEMSLTTFVAILRSSYSFYTLLNETK